MGHSLGSAIGFLYAASYSDETELLIAIDTVAPVVFDPSEVVKNTGPMLDKFVLLICFTLQMQCMCDLFSNIFSN